MAVVPTACLVSMGRENYKGLLTIIPPMSYLNFSGLTFHIFHKTREHNFLLKKMLFSVSLDSSPKTNIVKIFSLLFS